MREADSGDREAIVSIIKRAGNLTRGEEACAEELLDIYLNNQAQTGYRFVCAVDGADKIQGYACYGPRPLTDGAYDLYWIIVDPDARGNGAGRRLVNAVEERLKGNGGRLLIAETSGMEGYAAARRFYTGCGFREEARISGFYKPGDDLVVYVRRILSLSAGSGPF
ncbi:MAG: GNAT family N-acetyltransferase [Deltaproteobacteria bacterium]|nr:GNAT family N-acetyltransferase [Deltaproteobacteria bacterium]